MLLSDASANAVILKSSGLLGSRAILMLKLCLFSLFNTLLICVTFGLLAIILHSNTEKRISGLVCEDIHRNLPSYC